MSIKFYNLHFTPTKEMLAAIQARVSMIFPLETNQQFAMECRWMASRIISILASTPYGLEREAIQAQLGALYYGGNHLTATLKRLARHDVIVLEPDNRYRFEERWLSEEIELS